MNDFSSENPDNQRAEIESFCEDLLERADGLKGRMLRALGQKKEIDDKRVNAQDLSQLRAYGSDSSTVGYIDPRLIEILIEGGQISPEIDRTWIMAGILDTAWAEKTESVLVNFLYDIDLSERFFSHPKNKLLRTYITSNLELEVLDILTFYLASQTGAFEIKDRDLVLTQLVRTCTENNLLDIGACLEILLDCFDNGILSPVTDREWIFDYLRKQILLGGLEPKKLEEGADLKFNQVFFALVKSDLD